jgi:hypothetical protein
MGTKLASSACTIEAIPGLAPGTDPESLSAGSVMSMMGRPSSLKSYTVLGSMSFHVSVSTYLTPLIMPRGVLGYI